jgi:CheY-like chemotaxis protein
MTLGSAASRTGHEPGAPLPFFRPSGPTAGLSVGPVPGSQGMPPRRLPARLADDPPLGRILVIEGNAIVALDLQRILREGGFRVVGPAPSVSDAERLIARGPIDCAVLDIDFESDHSFAAADELDRRGIPIVFATSNPRKDLPEEHAHRLVITMPCGKEQVLEAVERAISRRADGNSEIWYPMAPPTISWPRVFPQL